MDIGTDAPYLAAGFLLGFFGGFLPGLHPNTMISVLASMGLQGRALGMTVISLFPANLVSSFIPAIFFGVPESGTVMAALPGQRMVQAGDGILALCTILLSSIIAALLSCALFFASLSLYPALYAILRPQMGIVLLVFSIVLLLRTKKPLASAAVFLLSGVFGHSVFSTDMPDPFLPLFCGMFSLASMWDWRGGTVPPQRDLKADAGIWKCSLLGVALGFIADLVPGIGSPSQIAVFATMMLPMGTPAYLATISAISISQAVFSLSTSASIGKSRVGATAWLSESMDIGTELPLLLGIFAASIALSSALAYALRNHAARLASLDFPSLRLVLAAYIAAMAFIIDGAPGVAVLCASALLGRLALAAGVERTNLMGAIIVPTLMLLFRIFPD